MRIIVYLLWGSFLSISCAQKTECESFRKQLDLNNAYLEDINKNKIEHLKASFEKQFLIQEIPEMNYYRSLYASDYIDSVTGTFKLITDTNDEDLIDSMYKKTLSAFEIFPIEWLRDEINDIIFIVDASNNNIGMYEIAYNRLLWIAYSSSDAVMRSSQTPFCGINNPIEFKGTPIRYAKNKTIVFIPNDHSSLITFNVTGILAPDEKQMSAYEVKNDNGNVAVLLNTAETGKYKIEGYLTCSDKRELPNEGKAECIFLIK